MSYRSLLLLGSVCLLIPAVTAVDTQHIDWRPAWPVRLALGGAGVLLALGAQLIGRRAPENPDGHKPGA